MELLEITKFWLNLEWSVHTVNYHKQLGAKEISKPGNLYACISSHVWEPRITASRTLIFFMILNTPL